MSKKFLTAALLALAAVFLFSQASRAQGVIVPIICDLRPCRPVPRPRPQSLPNALPVKSINIDVKINGQVATTHLEQVFRNDTQFTLEGTYFFPIPETASVTEFAIWENGKKLVGEVRTREEARRIYDEIVRRQRDPGLLEYAGKDLFQASIFPIPPNSDKKLELTYTQVLKAESGTVGYRYPLGTGRNVWQRALDEQIRNGQRPSAGQTFGTVSGKIEIVGKQALRNIYSPSHNVDVKRKGETTASVSFETKGGNDDFQLFYGLSPDDFGLSLMTYREPGKDGYFLLMMSPKENISERDLVSKDIVFVLDTSGSMAEEGKIDKARNALLFGIRTLRDGDRYNVVNFAGEEHMMESELIKADADGRRRGEEFVKKLMPTGGTNINDSLIASLKLFDSSARPKMVVFMTDGLPTVGEQDALKIASNVAKSKKADVRIFPFGFGYDVNTTLLDRLGAENAGVSDYVQPKEDLEVKVSNFFQRVSAPVLSDLELDFGGVKTDLMYPRRLTDIFRGSQVAILGRYKNETDLKNITLKLTGKASGESRTIEFKGLDFPARSSDNDFLPRLWASRRVGGLLEQLRANGESKELKDELVELGTKFGIVTPYTSYLATDGSFVAAPQDDARMRVQQERAAKSVREDRGAGAVQMSVQQNTMQSNIRVNVDGQEQDGEQILIRNTNSNQFIANKNFFNRSNVWVDTDFAAEKKLPETTVKFGSDEYFALVANERGLAQYLALGTQVVVVWNGRVYRVTE